VTARSASTAEAARRPDTSAPWMELVSRWSPHTYSPGATRTRRRNGWGETWAEVEPHVAADIPIGRIVRREEVADLVAFLASPRADAIHGQNIRIDGGALGVLT